MDIALLIFGSLVMAAVASTRFARRFGVPALVLFVFVGMLAGSSGPGGIAFEDYALAYEVGTLALAVILFSGGMNTHLSTLKEALAPALVLSTVGVALKLVILAALATWLTPLSWVESLLLGAVLAPTDAAAVFGVLSGQGLSPRTGGLLEAESSTNDPISIYLTLALTAAATGGAVAPVDIVSGVALQLVLGGGIGLVGGLGLSALANALRLPTMGLYPVLALAGGLVVFSAANLVGGNGFLAIYLAGLFMRARPLSHGTETALAMDTLAWGAQVGMFVLLGLLAFPDRLLGNLGVGLALAAGMVFVARPLTVLVALLPLRLWRRWRYSARELTLVSWAGLKGAVPIILAIVPLLHGLPHGELIFDIVFVVVISGTLLQGSTTVPLARVLGLLEPDPPSPPVRLELRGEVPQAGALEQLYLDPGAPAVGRAIRDLELPDDVTISVVVRAGALIPARGDLVLQARDHLFLVSRDGEAPPVLRPAGVPRPAP